MTDNKTSTNIILIVQNVFHPYAPLNVKIGDLFFTNEGFHFISYNDFYFGGSLETAFGYIVGGVALALASSVKESEVLQGQENLADGKRKSYYGFSIREREEDLKGSFSYSRDQFDKFEYISSKNRLTVRLKDGKELIFNANIILSYEIDAIESYPKTRSYYDLQQDPYGMNLGYPSPIELLKYFEKSEKNFSDDMLVQMSQKHDYIFAFCSQIMKQESKRQLSYIHALKVTPIEFRKAIINMISKNLKKDDSYVVGILLFFTSILIGGCGFFLLGSEKLLSFFLLIICGLMIFFGIKLSLVSIRKRRIARDIITNL